MILAHYTVDKQKVYQILERFHTKFKRRRVFKSNPNGESPPSIDTMQTVQIYKRTCKYIDLNKNDTKANLVIKIQYLKKKGYYILNVLYDDYKDLL